MWKDLSFPKPEKKSRAGFLLNLSRVQLQNFSCWGKLGVLNREGVEREYSLVSRSW